MKETCYSIIGADTYGYFLKKDSVHLYLVTPKPIPNGLKNYT
jgi:hypothetical protein